LSFLRRLIIELLKVIENLMITGIILSFKKNHVQVWKK